MNKNTLLFILLALGAPSAWSQSSEENAAQAAEQSGKLREALSGYVTALGKAAAGSTEERRIRESIIRVAQRISPRPPLPEEARNRMIRGRAAFKMAKTPAEMKEAADEFQRAANAAPWSGDAYFNLALALEKAESYPTAIESYRLYLLTEPSQKDAAQVRDRLVELQYLQERAQKQQAARQQKAVIEAAARKNEESDAVGISRLAGNWCASNLFGCGWETRISGMSIEFSKYECFDLDPRRLGRCSQKTWQVVFRGEVGSNEIAGVYFPEPGLGCPGRPMTGKVLGDDRILLTFPDGGLVPVPPQCLNGSPFQKTTTFTRR